MKESEEEIMIEEIVKSENLQVLIYELSNERESNDRMMEEEANPVSANEISKILIRFIFLYYYEKGYHIFLIILLGRSAAAVER
ncbi:unnamed protein product [Rhizophagus irregularis]|nr:unnamed protein product [Rhizophagus irregularis]CAB4416047.1 unnamed protein product [Rhizophagus irregularis]